MQEVRLASVCGKWSRFAFGSVDRGFRMNPKLFNQALQYYFNLSYHRGVILEGIRLIAFRNMGHFTRAREKCGTSPIDRHENIGSIRDQMIADQGLQGDTTNGQFFDFITWYPWDVYLCLLYAEIEYYQWYSKRVPELACARLDAFLKQNPNAIRYLKKYRDKVLHPGKSIELDASLGQFFEALDLDHISFYGIVVNIQYLIDAYAEAFRRTLYVSAIAEGYRITAGGPSDRTYLAAYKSGKTAKLEDSLEMLSKLLPKAADRLELEGRQTPMQLQSLLALMDTHAREARERPRREFPGFVKQARVDCLRCLMRALVLTNETSSSIDFEKLRAVEPPDHPDNHDPFAFLSQDRAPRTLQETVEWLAPDRVALALLAEPLRIYRQAAIAVPELSHASLDRFVANESVHRALVEYRNMMFHVPQKRVDLYRVETDLLSGGPDFYPKHLIRPLIDFYMEWPGEV